MSWLMSAYGPKPSSTVFTPPIGIEIPLGRPNAQPDVPLMAQSGHFTTALRCPLSGVKRHHMRDVHFFLNVVLIPSSDAG